MLETKECGKEQDVLDTTVSAIWRSVILYSTLLTTALALGKFRHLYVLL